MLQQELHLHHSSSTEAYLLFFKLDIERHLDTVKCHGMHMHADSLIKAITCNAGCCV